MSELVNDMLPVFAAMPLPLVAQKVLAKNSNVRIREILLASKTTHLDVVDTLLEVSDPYKYWPQCGYARTRNVAALTHALEARTGNGDADGNPVVYHAFSEQAVRNPLTPKQLLVDSLHDPGTLIAFGAMCNPATPRKARQNVQPEQVAYIVRNGWKRTNKMLRANEIITANPWMRENSKIWGAVLRDAVTEIPKGSATELLTEQPLPVDWPDMRPQKYDNYNTDELLTREDAAQIYAYNRSDFTTNHAQILLGQQQKTGRKLSDQLVGRFVNRYGLLILQEMSCRYFPAPAQNLSDKQLLAERAVWNDHRFATAELVAPLMGLVDMILLTASNDAIKAAAVLGENRRNWENFTALLPEWHGETCEEAAKAASRL